MIKDAKLSRRLGDDAVSTENYIQNRLPHKEDSNVAPFEILFDKRDDYNKFKVVCVSILFQNNSLKKNFISILSQNNSLKKILILFCPKTIH